MSFWRRRGYVALSTNRGICWEASYAITARSREQLVAERRCLLGLVPWRGTSLGRAFRAGLLRGWHAVLPIILPAEFPCWCRWWACLIVAVHDGGLALLLDRACAGLWTLFLEARVLRQFELQVRGRSSLTHSLTHSLTPTPATEEATETASTKKTPMTTASGMTTTATMTGMMTTATTTATTRTAATTTATTMMATLTMGITIAAMVGRRPGHDDSYDDGDSDSSSRQDTLSHLV